jgi:DNA ligase (NAD+)
MGETLHVPFYLQKIKVIKANQVIPQVTDGEIYGEVDGYFGMGDMLWYKDERAGNAAKLIMLPKVCPVCGKPVSIRKSESGIITLYCDNDGCPRKLNQRINHYCDRKKGLDIRGLSLATIEKLIDLGWLNNIIDLYSLKDHRSKWIKLQGFGEKSVDKILNAIEESKHCKLENFISALGIPLIGLTVAKSIVEYYSTWDDFKTAVGGQWSELPGFGEEMEKAINSFDYSEADKIAGMLSFEVPVIQSESPEDRPPAINVCVTGKLGVVWKKRDDLITFVESKGSKVTSSVSSKTDYLVCNDTASTSSKHQKAKSLNIPIITETELYELLS